MESAIYGWEEVARIPKRSGLYAWYYAPLISQIDIDGLQEKIRESVDDKQRHDAVRKFLEDRVFASFLDSAFSARISGSLKPQYSGVLEHEVNVSTALIERIVDDPNRLSAIGRLFDSEFALLASPLYIGMAKNLNVRVAQHRGLVLRRRESNFDWLAENDEEVADRSFAESVVSRSLVPYRLSVAVMLFESADAILDLENVLNRIFFPILGRN